MGATVPPAKRWETGTRTSLITPWINAATLHTTLNSWSCKTQGNPYWIHSCLYNSSTLYRNTHRCVSPHQSFHQPRCADVAPLSCWRCSVVGFPHTRHSACKKVLEFPNIVLSKVSKIRGWATASTRIPVAPYAGAIRRFHNCRQHLPPACGTKAAASWRSSWVGAQLSCCSSGDAAPAPDTFNHNYMGQIVSASSRQCRKSRSTLTLPTTGRVTSLQQNNIHTHPEPFRNILKWKPWGT